MQRPYRSPHEPQSGPKPVGPPPTRGPAARATRATTPPSPAAQVPDAGGQSANQPGSQAASQAASKIRAFDQGLGNRRHEDNWNRSPNVTGTGAIHVKSFHCKLTGDSLDFLDEQINEWLDAHPQYEVKFVTTSVGEWTGKAKEPNLIVNVWV